MSEKRKEEIQKEEYFNNKYENIDEDKKSLSQLEKEDITFESINFNINPFKIENSNNEEKNIVKHDDSTKKRKESEYNSTEYNNNNIIIEKKYEDSNLNPKNINDNLKKQEIKPYIDYNIQKSIELNQRIFNINNEKLNYLTPLSLKRESESNNNFALKDNKSTENIFNYNFDINRNTNTNTTSNVNSFTQFPFYNERINFNPSFVNNNNQISNINNKNIEYNNNYINKNNYIKNEDPSWACFSCNNSNNVGK